MTACDRYQAWMVEALYGELDDARRAEFESHVGACADCTALFSELQATAHLMSRRRRPDPGPEFWDGYWQRLEQRVAREDSVVVDASRFARRRSLGSWGYRVAAAVAVLVAGVWIGRTMFAPSPNTTSPQIARETARGDSTGRVPGGSDSHDVTQPSTDLAQNNVTSHPAAIDAPPGEKAPSSQHATGVVMASTSDEDAQRYIERSQLLLLAVLNGDPSDTTAFDAHKARAGELVRTASSVRDGSSDRRVQELVGQLELILREIAHLEAGSDAEAVEVIRSRVGREGVLLRINLEQMRADEPAHDGPVDGPSGKQ